MPHSSHPPRWAERLLAWCCPPHLREEMQGDLLERFEERLLTMDVREARRRYVRDVLGFLRPFAFKRPPTEPLPFFDPAMFRNYLLVAARNLRRHRVFSFIHVAGLSLGLACCMLILLYTKDEVSFDRFHERGSSIYRVTATMSGPDGIHQLGSTNEVVGPSFAEAIPEVAAAVRIESNPRIVRRGDATFEEEVLYVDANFFSVFSFPLRAGAPETVLSELHHVVLTEAAAEKYFGTDEALGKTLELGDGDTFESFVVAGIAENPPQNSSLQFSVLMPFAYRESQFTDLSWIGFYINTFLLLQPDADRTAVEPKLDEVFLSRAYSELERMKAEFNFQEKVHFGLQPFEQIHLDPTYGDIRNGLHDGSDPMYTYLLSGIAVFILLIACINFVNLTVAHSLKRGKEIGVRKVIGGQRRQLIRQFLSESFVLCFLAFVAALLLVQAVLPFFNELANKRLSVSFLFDAELVLSYVALFVVTSLLAGFYPAWVLSGYSPVQTLYHRHRFVGKQGLTKGLVVLQFALATFLLIGMAALYAQMQYLTTKELGYNDQNLIQVYLGRGRHNDLVQQLKETLAHEPALQAVATKSGGQSYTRGTIGDRDIDFAISWIDDQYLPALQIPLVAGRNFSPAFPTDTTQAVLVNETFVREAGWTDPVGQVVTYANKPFTVVGVVKDHHFVSLREKITPLLFQVGTGDLWVKLAPGQRARGLTAVREAHHRLQPYRPFDYEFTSTINARHYEAEQKWKQMITVGAGLSLFISCIGLFGLAILSIERRTKEIGIRKVLGAATSQLVVLLSGDFLKLVAIAFVMAIPLGYWAVQRWLEAFPYRIALGWWLFAVPCAATLLIALLTVATRTLHAAVANPVKALRSE
ncbi:ABC-type antimicrobial peptide transport system, permease component [Catalinimonas alkaloidigena]|uniref:ABC-type antimicrobial peptide transport system, permease component n=1 Tax=Catalinimonas alkaloidigena TaxID=1075417 RepID=A0A1G9G7D7_9BACT|nr:ABC transporter permease [Catalinimonas alkaloidigena]SDK96566.1 ABC-type antimicrobial peptide transport system, permease component [Catalinimonas alkaloidigena]